MRNRLLLGIVLVLILVLAVPFQVQAKHDCPAKLTHFTAEAQVAIIEMGTPEGGEIISGVITNCPQWRDIENATITMVTQETHSDYSMINCKKGTLQATTKGSIELVSLDGTTYLTGTFEASITGKFSISNNGEFTYCFVKDVAQWELNNSSGVEIAEGDALAILKPIILNDTSTLGGKMVIHGTHS
jgi:hypothetical protein